MVNHIEIIETELLELLILQSHITTVIIALTSFILSAVIFDIIIYLYKKYFKKGISK